MFTVRIMNPTTESAEYSVDMSKYTCHKCGRGGIRLWREYMRFVVELRCYVCVQSKEPAEKVARYLKGETDQIGLWIPAVPMDEKMDSYWGYTAVPQPGVDFWKRLPNDPY
jgi:hypothetical protein